MVSTKQHRFKNTLREMARHFGLKVKYVDYFSPKTHGKLIVREKIILINVRKPRNEHFYTLLHEVGHYVLHVLNPHRKFHPSFFDAESRINFLTGISSKVRALCGSFSERNPAGNGRLICGRYLFFGIWRDTVGPVKN